MSLRSTCSHFVIALAFAICARSAFCLQGPPTNGGGNEAKKPQTPAELLQVVKSNADAMIRQEALVKLGDISESDERNLQVTEVLVEIIKISPDPFLGRAAVRTLTRIQMNVSKRPKVLYISPFIAILKNPNALPLVRSEIAGCFKKTLDKDELKDRDAFVSLKAIAQSKTEQNVNLRAKCIEAIGSFGDPDNIAMLCELLADADPYIKEAAARGIVLLLEAAPTAGQNVSLAAINKIVEMVNDDTLGVDLRIIVIRADAQLMAIGTPGANKGLDTIIKLVKNAPDDRVVLASIEALGIIGTAQAADPLIQTYKDFFNTANAMNEKDVPIRRAVTNALRAVLTTQAGKPNPDLAVVHKVAELLISIVDNDPAPAVKEVAIYAMGYLYPKKFVPEHKEAVLSLIFLLARTDTPSNQKTLIPDSLEAITRFNYNQDIDRWKGWVQRTWPGARVP